MYHTTSMIKGGGGGAKMRNHGLFNNPSPSLYNFFTNAKHSMFYFIVQKNRQVSDDFIEGVIIIT